MMCNDNLRENFPHFYIESVCGYSSAPPRRDLSNKYSQYIIQEKISIILFFLFFFIFISLSGAMVVTKN